MNTKKYASVIFTFGLLLVVAVICLNWIKMVERAAPKKNTHSYNEDIVSYLYADDYDRVASMLARQEILVDSVANNGDDLISIAISKHNIKMVELLLMHKADINRLNPATRQTPLYIACSLGQADIVALLLANGANPNLSMPIYTAVRNDNIKIAKLLISSNCNVNGKDIFGCTPLYYVESRNMIDLLINSGANINVIDKLGQTPLFYAVKSSNMDNIKYFLKLGLNINKKNCVGETVLFEAVRNNDIACVELLIRCGADVEVQDIYGNDVMSISKNEKISELLSNIRQ